MNYSVLINVIVSLFFTAFNFGAADVFCPSYLPCNSTNRHLPSARLAPPFIRTGGEDFKLEAEKGAVLAVKGNAFMWEDDGDKRQPIASISKLMTALVFLDHNPGWEKVYQVTSNDSIDGGKVNLFSGEKLTIKDLFYTSLVGSDNGATLALVHATGLSEEDFIKEMNAKANKIGLFSTSFADPTGLSSNNQSTAKDVARLAKEAFANLEIRQAATAREHRYQTLDGRKKDIISTDYLLFDSWPGITVVGGKTGFIDSAGYCFVGQFRNKDGQEIVTAVLGAPGKQERFVETKKLVSWVFQNYAFN